MRGGREEGGRGLWVGVGGGAFGVGFGAGWPCFKVNFTYHTKNSENMKNFYIIEEGTLLS